MSAQGRTDKGTGRTVAWLLAGVVGMFGFGFALVPLYDVFCDITGLGGRTGGRVEATGPLEVDESRTVTVEFIATVNEQLPWEFRPTVSKMKVHPGERHVTTFYAHNRSGRAIVGQAIPSVAPGPAADHFKKTECFCFTEQTLEAGAERDMPLQFYIDPDLPADVHTVTLSYTFFDKHRADAGGGGDNKL